MKRLVLVVLTIVLAGFLVSDQAFAMGKRGGSSSSGKKFWSGSHTNNNFGDPNTPENFVYGSNWDENQNNGESNDENNPTVGSNETNFVELDEKSNESFPETAAVPEPATLTLMGLGLGGLLLRRKKG